MAIKIPTVTSKISVITCLGSILNLNKLEIAAILLLTFTNIKIMTFINIIFFTNNLKGITN
jgi:hypothetical protein